jgi:hypothetical protein
MMKRLLICAFGLFAVVAFAGWQIFPYMNQINDVTIASVATSDALRYTSDGLWENAALTVHAEDYGAVGDGSTDDTTALQAALDALEAAGGGTLRLADKTYKITAPLTIRNDYVGIRGESMNASKISHADTSGTENIISVTGASWVHLQDMSLLGDLGNGGNCVEYRSSSFNGYLRNVMCAGIGGNGAAFTNTAANYTITDCEFRALGGDGVYAVTAGIIVNDGTEPD